MIDHRAFLSILSTVTIFGCGGEEARSVRIELHLADQDCAADPGCGRRHSTDGVVAFNDGALGGDLPVPEGEPLLFADFETESGALAVLEIALAGEGEAQVRYRELSGGEVSFRGEVTSRAIALDRIGDGLEGRFAFTAIDRRSRGPDGGPATRIVTEGWVRSRAVRPASAEVPYVEVPSGGPPRRGGSVARPSIGQTVIIIAEGAGRTSPTWEGSVDGDGPDDVETESRGEPPQASDSGCTGDAPATEAEGCSGGATTSSADDSGCADASSSTADSGCADSAGSDSGGCDSSASSSSSGGGCSGDTASNGCSTIRAQPPAGRGALAGSWRLLWPIAVGAFANRRAKRRCLHAPVCGGTRPREAERTTAVRVSTSWSVRRSRSTTIHK